MLYNNHYQRLRIKCVQIFAEMYYEKENQRRCHKRNWERIGCFIFGISYETYLAYLKIDTSDIPPIPSKAIEEMQRLIDELLARESRPVRMNAKHAQPNAKTEERRESE